jgi:hypothetical protein
VVALLGAYTVQRHRSQVPALRQASTLLVAALREAGLAVLTDPALHAPGVVATSAPPGKVRAVLRGMTLGRAVSIASVDRSDLYVHPDVQDDQALHQLAAAITTVTIEGRRQARSRPSTRRQA